MNNGTNINLTFSGPGTTNYNNNNTNNKEIDLEKEPGKVSAGQCRYLILIIEKIYVHYQIVISVTF